MLDIKFIKENAELVKAGAQKKHIEIDIGKLLELDSERLAIQSKVEELRSKQNAASAEISNTTDKTAMIAQMTKIKAELKEEEEKLKQVMLEWQRLMLLVPNIPDMSVPEGESDEANVEVRKWGEIPQFEFAPKSHVELGQSLDLIDFERGVKAAGFRGYFLKGDLARMSMAIWNFSLDQLSKKGFTPMIVPSMVRREGFMGTGYLPQSEEDLYKTQDGEYLAGTGEVATMAYYMNEVLPRESLPVKFAAFSPCFRREIGAHGKDTKGMIRVHEFFKVEQVVLCEASHETSVQYHEELTKNAEELIQALGIPYHVVVNCGGDLGLGQVKKYDIECWVPSEGKYRETHSSSYFHDFQTRRLGIKYKDADGKLRFAHSLNNTGLATPRLLVAIMENYQQADGSIKIPEALVPYMGKDKIGADK